jgi:hypothetical protein
MKRSPTVAVSLLRNLGDGTFGERLSLSLEHRAEHIACADLNADGKEDLLVAGTRDSDPRDARLSILLNAGDFTFGPPTIYDFTDEVQCVAAPDLNADGLPDVWEVEYGIVSHGAATPTATGAATSANTSITIPRETTAPPISPPPWTPP